jgi:hypothetical protein
VAGLQRPNKGEIGLLLTRTRALLLASVLALLGLALTAPVATTSIHAHGGTPLLQQIREHRGQTWRWQRVMAMPLTKIRPRERTDGSPAYVLRLRDRWKARAVRARKRAHRPPHLRAWRCIHRYEGPWNDPNAPYYGGLQMDLSFQRTYGRRLLRAKGTADRWTPLEQMWVAEKAFRVGRGFYPWPTTARRCGLI